MKSYTDLEQSKKLEKILPIESAESRKGMTDKLELKSCHEVVDTVDIANIESIFHGKPTDPDILTVVMKDGKRLYCDEVCPIDSLQEEPVSDDLLSKVDKQAKCIWDEINTSHEYSIIDSYNQFYGICMQIAEAVVGCKY